MLAVVLGALLHLGAAGDLHAGGDVRATQAARSLDLATIDDVARAETTVMPRLALTTDGRLRLELAYEPSVILPFEVAGETGMSDSLGERTALLHRVGGGAVLSMPLWRLHAGGRITSGDTLLFADPAAGTAEGQAVSTFSRLAQFGAEAEAGATGELSRGTSLRFSAGASHGGGADDEARVLLPIAQTVRVAAGLDRRVSRRHTVGVQALGTRTRLGEEAIGDAGYFRAGGSWAWEMDPRFGLRSAAGAALTYERTAPPDLPTLLPWIESTLSYVPAGTRPGATLGAAFEPVVDRFSGDVDLRGSAHATVGWAPLRRWTFGVRGSTSAQFRPDDTSDPHTVVHAAALSASHEVAEHVRLALSAGSTWQLTDRADLLEFREDLVLLELTSRLFSL